VTRLGARALHVGRKLLTTIIIAYALVCVVARCAYRRILYPAPKTDGIEPPAGARILELRAADGVPVHAMEFANERARRTIVYLHGNGEVIGDDVWMARAFVAQGFAATLVEYRGYGRSHEGAPTEAGLYADAEAVLDDLAARGVGRERIVLWGASLGTGVAAEMARRGRASALVLVAPYTSTVAMGERFAPFLPVRLLMGDRYDTLASASSLRLPAIVVHGTDDEVIPFAMGERVAAAIQGARLFAVKGAHHMDCFLTDQTLMSRVTALVAE
jgi:pimeloyl-ACP methyl ester carboxylesterase